MNHNYVKVFPSMFTGSMYGAGCHVFATWAWVLTHKDEHGHVEVNVRLVAAEIGADVEQIEKAMEYLTSPDPNSRSPDEDGRRMVRTSQFGYRVVNHEKYRDHGKDRTEYWRGYKAKTRAGSRKDVKTVGVDKVDSPQCPHLSTPVHSGQSGLSTISTHADADVKADVKAEEETTPVVVVSSREGPRGDDGGADSPFVSTVAKDVKAECRKVIDLWNTFAKQPVRSLPEELTVESRYSAVRLGIPPNRLTFDQIVGAVENYRMACTLPASQAPKLGLARFLQPDLINKYLPAAFTLEHYDSIRFDRSRGDGNHPCAKRHVGGCSGPGVHRHAGDPDWWLCDAHEAQARKAVAV